MMMNHFLETQSVGEYLTNYLLGAFVMVAIFVAPVIIDYIMLRISKWKA